MKISETVRLELDKIIREPEYAFWETLENLVDQGPSDDINYEIVGYSPDSIVLLVTGYTQEEV